MDTFVKFVVVSLSAVALNAASSFAVNAEEKKEVAEVTKKTPSQQLEHASSLFEEGEYQESQKILSEILFPEPSLTLAEEIVKAQVLLAAAHLALGNMKAADRVVKVIIDNDVKFRFEPHFDPSLIAMAERHRQVREKELAKEAALKPAPPPPVGPLAVEPEPTSMGTGDVLLHLLPFGVGQFADGRYVAGALYFLVQAGLGAANIYFYNETVTAKNDQGELVCSHDTMEKCDERKTLINALGGAFVASMALSVAESFVFASPSSPSNRVEPTMSFNVFPTVDGGAASFSVSF